MFFSRVVLFFAATMASFAIAAPYLHPGGEITNSCNTGSIQCCDQLFSADGEQANWLGGQAGLSCVPVTAIGVGSGAQCGTQPVCCSENHMNGLVTLGCNPVGVNV